MAYKTHIQMLDNDSLLQIFSYYRQEQEGDWNLRLAWRMIAHVCQRWRYLIFDSSSYLDICLLTNDSPSKDMLVHLPPVSLCPWLSSTRIGLRPSHRRMPWVAPYFCQHRLYHLKYHGCRPQNRECRMQHQDSCAHWQIYKCHAPKIQRHFSSIWIMFVAHTGIGL